MRYKTIITLKIIIIINKQQNRENVKKIIKRLCYAFILKFFVEAKKQKKRSTCNYCNVIFIVFVQFNKVYSPIIIII